CFSVWGALATGEEDVTWRCGFGFAGKPGEGGFVRYPGGAMGVLLRQCARGKAKRAGGAEDFQRALCGARRCFRTGRVGEFFSVSNTGERSGKALPGGHRSPVQLPPFASRSSGPEQR